MVCGGLGRSAPWDEEEAREEEGIRGWLYIAFPWGGPIGCHCPWLGIRARWPAEGGGSYAGANAGGREEGGCVWVE